MNTHIIISITVTRKSRLPEKPMRPTIAGRFAKKFQIKKKTQTNIYMCTVQEYGKRG